MIIATAGHVDHGKTTLLAAITGVNADRLPEEKKRGMTIDLGYAYWPQADGRIVGFIDVPGHQKFLANMLSGIGGIDHALLVVACDDGVMAQTVEHLAILALTGQPAITVALSKADRVTPQRVSDVQADVLKVLRQFGWQHASLFVTAATQGRGIVELSQHLQTLPDRPHPRQHRFRLAIDRAFNVKGSGLVVTGTALSGEVKIGDTLWLTGADKPMRVRGLHAQNNPVEIAHAGQRIALNISGEAEKTAVNRGDWLLEKPPPGGATTRVLVELKTINSLGQWQPLHIHHAASHITGRVSLLANDLAELVLDTPLWLADNDRLVLRDISARTTLGGARVLLLQPPRRGKRQPAFLAWLQQLAYAQDDREACEVFLQRGPLSITDWCWARQLTTQGMVPLLAEGHLKEGDSLISEVRASDWQRILLDTLSRYHHQHEDQPGLGPDRLRRMALPGENPALVLALINRMRNDGLLANRQGWLHLPSHHPQASAEQQLFWQQVEPLFTDEPWWVRDLAQKIDQDEKIVRQRLRVAAQLGRVVAILPDRYYSSSRIHYFAQLICQLIDIHEVVSAADFRDLSGTGRKLAIQILEYFDRSGFTLRRGNGHILRDKSLFITQAKTTSQHRG